MVGCKAHKKGLPAAFLAQKNFAGGQIGVHGNGVGSGKVIQGQPEGFFHGMALFNILLNGQGYNFGIRGDVIVDSIAAEFELTFELLKIINIAI